MTRLTDEEIDQLYLIADTHTGGITMSRDRARKMLTELRARRAADLSVTEVEELEWLVRRIKEGAAAMNPHANHTVVLLGALAKVLAAGGAK